MMSITAVMGGGKPRIFGLGANNGLPYLISSQENNGDWTPGFELPSSYVTLSNLMVAPGQSGLLQAVGRGPDAEVYPSASQDIGGVWHPGSNSPLP
jgi:hypothetical protein